MVEAEVEANELWQGGNSAHAGHFTQICDGQTRSPVDQQVTTK